MDLLRVPKTAARVSFRLVRLPLTTYEVFTQADEEPVDAADAARQGLVVGTVGKVKQIAGIVLGDESLVRQGQLAEARAEEAQEAATNAAVAERKRDKAQQEYAQRQAEVTDQRVEAAKEEAQRKAELERERQERKAAADDSIDLRADQVERAAEARKKAAAEKQRRAAAKKTATSVEAAQREKAANEAQRKAKTLERARTASKS
jgi:hypothetical protein